ncbi:MAG: hypothetical protein HY400_03845 [Elusimicrobia bacterium]|nr:hypothetical protein [Elusimicrobiota bacterium]
MKKIYGKPLINLSTYHLIILSSLLIIGCSSTQRLKVGATEGGEVVEAEGMVPYNETDLPGTKSAALAAAQRSAVEKAVGVYVSAKTRVEKAVLVESKILANTSGYISKYDVLKEGRDGEYYKTRIRALVLLKKVGEDLENLGLLSAEVGNPRVAVLIEETIDGNPSDSPDASNALSSALIDRGYIIVDRSAMAGAATQKIIDAVEKGDLEGAVDLGQQVKAEVVLVGQGQASELKNGAKDLGGFVSYRGRVSLQAVRSGTGQILATTSQEASGLNVNKPLAAAKALEGAAKLAGEEIAGKLLKSLKAQTLEIQIHQIKDLDQLKKFQENLSSQPEVKGVYLRNYSQGEASISISGTGINGEKMAALFSKDSTLAVNNISPSSLDVTFK